MQKKRLECSGNVQNAPLRRITNPAEHIFAVMSTSMEDFNLKGKFFRHYDEAGLIEIPLYDFKGNVLEKTRKVISDSELLSVFGESSFSYSDRKTDGSKGQFK